MKFLLDTRADEITRKWHPEFVSGIGHRVQVGAKIEPSHRHASQASAAQVSGLQWAEL